MVTYFLYFILILYAKCYQELDGIKIKACLAAHRLRMRFDGENYNSELLSKSMKLGFKREEILLMAVQMCYYSISEDLALRILNDFNKEMKIDVKDINIINLFSFEKYDINDKENNKKKLDNFLKVFDEVIHEIRKFEQKLSEDPVMFYRNPLFKFFVMFAGVNIFIVFYTRFKNKDKINSLNEELKINQQIYLDKIKKEQERLEKEKAHKTEKKIENPEINGTQNETKTENILDEKSKKKKKKKNI